MGNIIVTVVVPVYNAEDTLRQCVDSILDQTYADFEMLLIDDGSKDTSSLICDEYASKDARIRVVHRNNGGLSSVRNLGINMAKGKWITFVDSDDYVSPSLLEDLMSLKSQEYRLCNYQGDCQNDILPSLLIPESSDFVSLMKQSIHYTTWSKLYSLKVIRDNNLQFDTNMRLGEDTVFSWQYMSCINSFSIVDKKDYYYTGIFGGGPKYQLKVEEDCYRLKCHFAALDRVCSAHDIKCRLYNDHLVGVMSSYYKDERKDDFILFVKSIPNTNWRGNAQLGGKIKLILFLSKMNLYHSAYQVVRSLSKTSTV